MRRGYDRRVDEVTEPRELLGDRRAAPGALRLVQELVNTLDVETGEDALPDAQALSRWLVAHDLVAAGTAVTELDVVQTRELRESIRALLLAHTGVPASPAHVATFERIAQDATLCVALDPAGAPDPAPARTGVPGAWAALFAAIAVAAVDGSWPRLKACRSDTCHGAFYDRSRNGSGRWCSLELCGTPAKMRRHRREQRAARTP